MLCAHDRGDRGRLREHFRDPTDFIYPRSPHDRQRLRNGIYIHDHLWNNRLTDVKVSGRKDK